MYFTANCMIRGAVPAASAVILPKSGLLNVATGLSRFTVFSTLKTSQRS